MEQIGNYKVGEWVKGKYKNSELFHGYIESIELFFNSVKVRVIKSDNEDIEGKSISVIESKLERLETSVTYTKEALLNLLDVALLIKDENWFKELSAQLGSINAKAAKGDSNIKIKKENMRENEQNNQKGRK